MPGTYLSALLLTLAVEEGVACLLGFRRRKALLAIALINIITHVVLNYLLVVLGALQISVGFAWIVVFEMLVVVAEWRLLVYVFGKPQGKFFMTSLLANLSSFLVGLLVFWG